MKPSQGGSKFKGKFKRFTPSTQKVQKLEADLSDLIERCKNISTDSVKTFADLPLSRETQEGLRASGFTEPTEIQREAIPLALAGRDVIAAAKTGSGKTLAFIVPILERLVHERWTNDDGLGALVISPTRELAYQIFETLRKVGKGHQFSAALIIGGGTDLRTEARCIPKTNILVATPGRLLQHFDTTFAFAADTLRVLVLDEADKTLELGFAETLNALIEHLPVDRQTMLFSATQTRSVKDLARLSVREPVFVSVHERAKTLTPDKLRQSFVECRAEQKLDFIWSFMTQHTKAKTIVFFATCKQVRYAYEAMRKLQPGVSLLALYGTMSQPRRVAVYDAFARKHNAVLFATDLAARGLDFSAVRYVVQLDCPEDAVTYVHRVGRTARLDSRGEAVLVLEPHQREEMLSQLASRRCGSLEEIAVNPRRIITVRGRLEAQLAGDPELKELAKRAVVAYLKSIRFMPNRQLFDLSKLDIEALACSYGLPNAPRIRFKLAGRSKREKVVGAAKSETTSKAEKADRAISLPSDDDEPILVKKATTNEHMQQGSDEEMTNETDAATAAKKERLVTKAALAKKQLRIRKHLGIPVGNKTVFNEDEDEKQDVDGEVKRKKRRIDENEATTGIDFEERREWMAEQDRIDKEAYRERIKQKHRERRAQEKLLRKRAADRRARVGDDDEEDIPVVLGTPSDSEDDNHSNGGENDDEEDDSDAGGSGDEEDEDDDSDQGKSKWNNRHADNHEDESEDEDERSDGETGTDDEDGFEPAAVERNEQLALELLRKKRAGQANSRLLAKS